MRILSKIRSKIEMIYPVVSEIPRQHPSNDWISFCEFISTFQRCDWICVNKFHKNWYHFQNQSQVLEAANYSFVFNCCCAWLLGMTVFSPNIFIKITVHYTVRADRFHATFKLKWARRFSRESKFWAKENLNTTFSETFANSSTERPISRLSFCSGKTLSVRAPVL